MATRSNSNQCPVDGPQEPVPYGHKSLRGAIPAKCGGCRFFFEGMCRKISNRLLRLDYGDCGIEGSKELVDHPVTSRKIPWKCSQCEFLVEDANIKLVCGKDPEVWGDFPRGLDY